MIYAILPTFSAATNAQVDTWNERVQLLNTNEIHNLLSMDKLSQVDDPNAHLQNIIHDEVLHDYVVNGVLLHSLSKRFGLATNSRVLILSISQYCIRTKSGDTHAYCMTYNKAQGQTLESVLLDITSPPFAHGHLYVALSRVTHYANIKVFCNEKSINQ
jgi:hypothetical protein